MGLTPDQRRFWREYVDTLSPENRPDGSVIAACPGSPDIADQLIDLYLSGKKIAGSGLVEDYSRAGDPLPKIGDHWIALGSDGDPRCILRTVDVETHLFKDVPERIAVAEGEGDLSLAYWKRAHAEHFRPHLSRWGVTDIEQATVITEFFALAHR
ncbi:ASCH domain-containing protein [Ammonicoccus fulvus]|uniref:ASCH domain-containing protein n=1 Tax=Ammonicoccus fulvus TaxID=3138240 RepID=A0ABZ3FTL2_9ACTN